MTSPSDTSRAGFTLFEVLITLAILSVVIGVVIAARPGASPQLKLKADTSALIEQAAMLRNRAVTSGTKVEWQDETRACDETPFAPKFYPDGTSDAGELCLKAEDRFITLELDGWTGRLSVKSP